MVLWIIDSCNCEDILLTYLLDWLILFSDWLKVKYLVGICLDEDAFDFECDVLCLLVELCLWVGCADDWR